MTAYADGDRRTLTTLLAPENTLGLASASAFLSSYCAISILTWCLMATVDGRVSLRPNRSVCILGSFVNQAARAPLYWPHGTALIVPSGKRVRIDILVALYSFAGHLLVGVDEHYLRVKSMKPS